MRMLLEASKDTNEEVQQPRFKRGRKTNQGFKKMTAEEVAEENRCRER
jgi:hypothetical protein